MDQEDLVTAMTQTYDVLLINPPLQKNTGLSRQFRYEHLGLGSLASALRNNGFSVKVVDAPLLNLTEEDVELQCERIGSRLIGITLYSVTSASARKLASHMKRRSPTPHIAFGGVFSHFPLPRYTKRMEY